jgi:hypothetical protein
MRRGTLRSSSDHTPTASTASPHSNRLSESTKTIAKAIASDLQSIRQHQHKISLSSRSVTPTHHHHTNSKQHTLKSSVSSIELGGGSSSRRSSALLASMRPLSPPPTVSPPPAPPTTTTTTATTITRRGSRGSLTLAQAESLLRNLDATLTADAPVVPLRSPARGPVLVGRSASAASLGGGFPSIAATAGMVVGGVGRPMLTLPPRMPPPDIPLPMLPSSLIGQ